MAKHGNPTKGLGPLQGKSGARPIGKKGSAAPKAQKGTATTGTAQFGGSRGGA